MSLISTVLHRRARQAIVAQVITIAVATLLAAWAAAAWSFRADVLVSVVATTAVAVCAAGLVAAGFLDRVLDWDRKLAALHTSSLDPFALTTASGSTPADHGWNRLVEQGRCWQTLSELETALSERLAEDSRGDAEPLLDAISEGVAAINAEGVITHANAAMAGLCGKDSSRDVLGKPIAEILGVDEPTAALFHGTPNQSQETAEWSVPVAGGIERLQRGTRRLLPGGLSDGSTFVWTIRDVTQQRLAESMRERFLSAATHEFRTPLANIRAYAESLDMGHDIDAEARKRFYNVIQSESIRLSQLVDDLLDISRMQAGALALDCRETDLGRLVDEAASKVQAEMQEKGVQLRCELPPKFPKITADKSKLTSALVNLLGNAAKYTTAGGKVTFRVEVGAQRAQFTVADTGIGIAAEELSQVFNRFFRSADERVRELSGSGLGLALAQEIARLHGGDITVESKLNQGSTFRLTIPLDLAP